MFGVEYHIITSFLFLETLFSTFSKYSPTHESATHESAHSRRWSLIRSGGGRVLCIHSRRWSLAAPKQINEAIRLCLGWSIISLLEFHDHS